MYCYVLILAVLSYECGVYFVGTLTMVVACGPFTISDNDLYEPLDDLLKYLDANPPDVCILVRF